MSTKLDEAIVQTAANAPKVFLAASMGAGAEYQRAPGIQLTKEQIISLRKYEALALSLPTRHDDVAGYLNYGAGERGTEGLTVADFVRTFKLTNDHARRWSPLRHRIQLTGTDLKVFAGSILRLGDSFQQVYDEHRANRYLEDYNITTPEEYQTLKLTVPNLPGLELDPGDVADIKSYLKKMLDQVRSCYARAKSVEADLASFGAEMNVDVVPEIKRRLGFVIGNSYAKEIQALQAIIDARAAEIDELNDRYDQLVVEAIKSATTFNVGGLILGIYQGVKAEEVRKERKELQAKQEVSNRLMDSKDKTLSSLNRVRGDLQDLKAIAVDAQTATKNLMLVWSALTTFIENSDTAADGFEDAISVRQFTNQIIFVISPWADVKMSADALLEVFAEADAEYEKDTKNIRSSRKVFTAFSTPRYTPYNVLDLRKLNAEVQAANIHSQMLSQQYDYLPGVVATMKNIGVAIDSSDYAVREHAQSGIIQLNQTARRLKGFQGELGDPYYIDEVRQDMEKELHRVFIAFRTTTDDLKGIKAGMVGGFDRSASAGWVSALEQDVITAEKNQAVTVEKIAALQAQMKSVSEAIDLIGKAGIEKIGQEAQLTVDNLQALGMAPPQVQVALLAIDTLKKIASSIGDAVSYFNMLAGHDRLKKKLGDLKAQSTSYSKNITRFKGRIEMVQTLDRMDDARQSYVNEFEAIINAFAQFSRDLQQDKSMPVEERVVVALARIPVIIEYLDPVQR